MGESLAQSLRQILGGLTPLAFVLSFLGGVVTSIGPCNLSMVPVLIAYVSGGPAGPRSLPGGRQDLSRSRGFWLSLFFTLGSSVTFVLLGVIAATLGGIFGPESRILRWLVAAVCFVIGLRLLGALKLNLDFLTRLQPKGIKRAGFLGAFLLGLVIGLAGSQCATPVLAVILSIALEKGDLAYAAGLLFSYALGRGVPIVLAGTFTGLVEALPGMQRLTTWIERAAGIVLIAMGLYFIWIA